RRHFGLFLKLAVTALSVPLVLLVYFALRALTELQQNPVHALLYLLPIGLVYYVASLVLTTGTIRIISDSYVGREPRLRDALSLGWSKIWPLTAVGFGKAIVMMLIVLGCGVVVGIAVAVLKGAGALLAIAMVVAGTWFALFVACGYGVTTPVVVLEELRSSFDAFGRSWELTRSFKLKVAGLFFVAVLLTNFIPSLVFRGLGAAGVRLGAALQSGRLGPRAMAAAARLDRAPADGSPGGVQGGARHPHRRAGGSADSHGIRRLAHHAPDGAHAGAGRGGERIAARGRAGPPRACGRARSGRPLRRGAGPSFCRAAPRAGAAPRPHCPSVEDAGRVRARSTARRVGPRVLRGSRGPAVPPRVRGRPVRRRHLPRLRGRRRRGVPPCRGGLSSGSRSRSPSR